MDVEQAMRQTPREQFLPRDQQVHAAADRALPIGAGQTGSQPSTVRAMLELLDVLPGQRVLDVGSGSGWTTALLARLVAPGGVVLGVELDPDLAAWGAQNVAASGVVGASVRQVSREVLGHPEGAPYDRILVSANAGDLPRPLVDQLADGGVMVLPVQGRMTRVRRRGSEIDVEHHGAYRFVPLR
jgi:protein-L-isoaspartate(D-aspartate) O-methyltransferase